MDLEQGLLTRRSVRRFAKNRSISKKEINELLNIAMHAPSARDSQCWEFVVIDDRKKLEDISKTHPYATFAKDASLAILVCGNTKEQMGADYWVLDAAAATNTLLLAAHAKGLGSCWCGIYPEKDRMVNVAKLCELPPYVNPLSLVVLGYKTEETKQPLNRFKVNKIHSNKW